MNDPKETQQKPQNPQNPQWGTEVPAEYDLEVPPEAKKQGDA